MNKDLVKKQIGKLLITLLFVSPLGACSGIYNNSFACGDGKGANCMPIDKVDRLIASGEIERYTEENRNECKGRRCKKQNSNNSSVVKEEEVPVIKSDELSIQGLEG